MEYFKLICTISFGFFQIINGFIPSQVLLLTFLLIAMLIK